MMKVTEVVIERIGNKKNANEVKEGYIYFTNESQVSSKKYKFIFNSQNSNCLTVKIDEENYWKYMIIEPIYSTGKKMPYEIGFVGAKGETMDIDNYNDLLNKYVEENVEVFGEK